MQANKIGMQKHRKLVLILWHYTFTHLLKWYIEKYYVPLINNNDTFAFQEYNY